MKLARKENTKFLECYSRSSPAPWDARQLHAHIACPMGPRHVWPASTATTQCTKETSKPHNESHTCAEGDRLPRGTHVTSPAARCFACPNGRTSSTNNQRPAMEKTKCFACPARTHDKHNTSASPAPWDARHAQSKHQKTTATRNIFVLCLACP